MYIREDINTVYVISMELIIINYITWRDSQLEVFKYHTLNLFLEYTVIVTTKLVTTTLRCADNTSVLILKQILRQKYIIFDSSSF